MKKILFILTAFAFMAVSLNSKAYDCSTSKNKYEMKTYKVIALSVGALNNKIFNSGDIVKENAFLPGRADQLVKEKFLEPVITDNDQEDLTEPVKPFEEAPAPVDENPQIDLPPARIPLSIDEFETSDIKINLANHGITFDSNASKQELYDLWLIASEKR